MPQICVCSKHEVNKLTTKNNFYTPPQFHLTSTDIQRTKIKILIPIQQLTNKLYTHDNTNSMIFQNIQ